ncbi:linear amide C-N hydrolase [uncultured Vibrio sp.]|uniref:linear amide C-N hydrolase n=1 Tax=uncultured Vibrio sp. TaxID=114054 RepID=UPI0025F89B0F|nr:linear amide C-N hydrolase [uncultured Vibrio sp.]
MKKTLITSALLSAVISSGSALACSNVFWDSPEGVVLTRTMDWMESTQPLLLTVRKGEERYLHGSESENTYTVKHDFLAIAGYGKLVGEGVNEKGLHSSLQYYREMSADTASETQLSQNEVVAYVLANFASVEEVIENVEDIDFGLTTIPTMAEPPLWHYIVSDKSGDRALIQYDADGMKIYRGDDAQVVTNTSQADLLDAWKEKQKALKHSGGYNSTFALGAGNTDSEQRFLFANYYVSQLETATSPTNAMMSVEGTAFKVPQQAAYKPGTALATYATEYTITYNLNSGDVVFKYSGENWSQEHWNYKTILASYKDVAKPLYQ